jgi:hypothetical protein
MAAKKLKRRMLSRQVILCFQGTTVIDLRVVERDFGDETVNELESVLAMFEDSKPSLLHLLWLYRDALASEYSFEVEEKLFDKLRGFGLVEITRRTKAEQSAQAEDGGKSLGDAGTP